MHAVLPGNETTTESQQMVRMMSVYELRELADVMHEAADRAEREHRVFEVVDRKGVFFAIPHDPSEPSEDAIVMVHRDSRIILTTVEP
jgi:hypothetical protein